MTDLRPPLGPNDAAFGAAATVTVPGGAPVAASVIDFGPRFVDFPAGGELTIGESRRRFALRRDQVAAVPLNTKIEIGTETFFVDGVDVAEDRDYHRVLVRA